MTDPITDMLNRINNAQAVLHPAVSMPFSKLKYEIAKVLEKQGLIKKAEKKGRAPKRVLKLDLKYQKEEGVAEVKPAISKLKRISKPGQRIYIKAKEVKKVRGGYGIAVISTPKGIMTNEEAKRLKLGGEVLCEIW